LSSLWKILRGMSLILRQAYFMRNIFFRRNGFKTAEFLTAFVCGCQSLRS